jgi:hypothetical protein
MIRPTRSDRGRASRRVPLPTSPPVPPPRPPVREGRPSDRDRLRRRSHRSKLAGFGRSHRRAQGDRSTLRWIRPARATPGRMKRRLSAGRRSSGAKCRPATRPESGRSERSEWHLRPECHKPFCRSIVAPSLSVSGCPDLILFRSRIPRAARIWCMDAGLAKRRDRAALRRRPPGAVNALRPGSRAAPAQGGAAPGLAALSRARSVACCPGLVRRRRRRAGQATGVFSRAVRVGSTPATIAARHRPLGDHRLKHGTQIS